MIKKTEWCQSTSFNDSVAFNFLKMPLLSFCLSCYANYSKELMLTLYIVLISPVCLSPGGLTCAGLCSPTRAAIRASGAVTPLPGDTGLQGLRAGACTGSGEMSRSFFAAKHGERLRVCPSLERGERLRPCREGRGFEERAGTAGLRLRRWWCLPVLGLGLREFGASRTRVLSSSELSSELSERQAVGLQSGTLIWTQRRQFGEEYNIRTHQLI